MSTPTSVQEIVDHFTEQVAAGLNQDQLDGPVRLDPTRTTVIIPLKERGPIHVHVQHQINDEGARNVLKQIAMVPSLKGLLRSS